MRFKGIRTSSDEKNNSKEFTDKVLIDKIIKDELNAAEMHDLYYYTYEEHGGHGVNLSTYERLLQKKDVYILCSNIEKKIAGSNEALILRSRFVMKTIDSKGNNEDKVLL